MKKRTGMAGVLLLVLIFCPPVAGQKKKLDTNTAEYLKKSVGKA